MLLFLTSNLEQGLQNRVALYFADLANHSLGTPGFPCTLNLARRLLDGDPWPPEEAGAQWWAHLFHSNADPDRVDGALNQNLFLLIPADGHRL